jgi:hypothetical protein
MGGCIYIRPSLQEHDKRSLGDSCQEIIKDNDDRDHYKLVA